MEFVRVKTPWGNRGKFGGQYAPETTLETIRDEAVAFYEAQYATLGAGPFALSHGASVLSLELTVAEVTHEDPNIYARFGVIPGGGVDLRLVPIYLGDPPKGASRVF